MASLSLPGGHRPSFLAPGWWRDPLAIGLMVSLAVHLIFMTLRFALPEPMKFAPYDSRLEVVLLNARTQTAPVAPEALAQVDMEAGGDRDQGRARSPLQAQNQMQDGNELVQKARRVSQLEEQQRKLLELARGSQTHLRPEQNSDRAPTPQASGADEQLDQAISRLQAQIDKQISDYNKRPRRLTYGVNAKGVSFARYVDDWADRIERIGTERYPAEARGRLYDSLICTVEIDRNGNVVGVTINKRSKHEALNSAVRKIVLLGAPYPKFTPEMAREGDVLQIVRTWTFTRKGLATEAVEAPAHGAPAARGRR